MTIIDYSAVGIAGVFSQANPANGGKMDEAFLRHVILNSLRMYNLKYREKHGKTIIACDGGSWRKDYFPEYKASRKKNRDASTLDWNEIFRVLNKVRDEITEHMPYTVISVKGAEADDVIATLVETTQEFGAYEEVMIVSADKDFLQLQKYANVKQFSPVTKKLITDKNPQRYLFEHIIKGDSGDGVPNIKSEDTTFIDDDKRQTPIRATKIEEWFKAFKEGKIESVLTADEYRNFKRNKTCIDLSEIPESVKNEILAAYTNAPVKNNSKVFNYLIMNRCNNLLSCAEEFFQK